MKYFVGCHGWRYGSWLSDFYPDVLSPRDYLSYYSRVFDLATVSMQTTQSDALKQWAVETPDNFRFIVRMPSQAANCDLLGKFLEGLAPIEEKVLAVVLQVLATCDVQKLTDRIGRNGLWMWRVANGLDDEAVQPREDHVSLSTEHTLNKFTRDKDRILVHLNERVDEIYGRLVRRGYMFRTVGIKLVRTDFTTETRETSFPDLQIKRESISSVIEQLLGRFSFDDRVPAVRKVGLRVTNLISVHEEESQIKMQKTILDYIAMPLSDM